MNPAAAFLPAALLMIALLSPLASAAHPPPVTDTHGKPVFSGLHYHILPAADTITDGYGGGLTLDNTGDHSKAACQLGVHQEGDQSSLGLPVSFSHAYAADVQGPTTIPTATDVSIQFEASLTCARTTVWKLGRFDQVAKKWFVQIGGEEATHGRPAPSKSLFKIVKVDWKGQVLFKIVFCPSEVLCKDVGIFVDGKTGARRLALVNHGPFLVQFKRA